MMNESAIVKQAAAFCRQWDMLPADGTVLCAVSGGRDSMALLHILRQLAEASGLHIIAAHFNHHLRPAADRDEAFVHDWCAAHNITFLCGSGDVRAAGTGIEDAARILRYRFLEDAAARAGASRIATAHHRDDNAETVLLHLLRGAGLHGLCGIPPVRGRIIRPLLEISRAEIDAYVEACGIPYVEDETNRDTVYTRNRIRLEVLPLLEAIVPNCTAHIASAGELLREEDVHLQAEASALLPDEAEEEITLPLPVWNRQDTALRRRLVRTMGLRLGITPTRAQVEAVLSLGSGGMVNLPQNVSAIRRPHQLIFRKNRPLPPPLVLQSGVQRWGSWQVTLREGPAPSSACQGATVLDASAGPLTLAAWDGTGRLALENGSRTLKRIFMDHSIPVDRRQEYPVLYAGGNPAAVPGIAVGWNCRPQAGHPALIVILKPEKENSHD